MAILKNTTISDTGFLQLPAGTTAQRPGAAAGQMRYNTTTGQAEFYNAGVAAWVGTPATGVVATGGTVYDVDVEGTTYRVHVFTTTGNSSFTVSQNGPVEYLIVGGGGSAAMIMAVAVAWWLDTRNYYSNTSSIYNYSRRGRSECSGS